MSLTKIGSIGINTGIAFAGVTTIVTLNTANDALSIGATVNVGSGITLGASGDIFATGVSTFSGNLKVGSGVTISPDGDGFYTGVVTATSYAGSGANLTGIDTDLVSDTSPQLGGNLDVNTKNIVFGDSGGATDDRLTFGAGTDLSIYHNGSDSYIEDGGTGALVVKTNLLSIRNAADDEQLAKFVQDSAVELYHNNSKKFETISTGVVITGSDDGDGGAKGDFKFFQTDGTLKIMFDASTSQFEFLDNSKASFGNGDDLKIYHDGNSRIQNTNNSCDFRIQSDSVEIKANSVDEYMIKGTVNAAVELFHNNVKKFETHDVGTIFTEAGSGTTQAAIKVNTTLDTYGSVTVRDKRDVDNAVAAFQVENASNGSNETNLLLRSVNLGSSDYSHGLYAAKSHRFAVSNNTTPTVQIDSDGLKFNNDQASANALDDYEEGTFTPNVSQGGSVSSYSEQRGSYRRIGSLINFNIYLQINGSGNGDMFKIGGLPFTSSSSLANEGFGGAWFSYDNNAFQSASVLMYVPTANATLNFHLHSGGNFNGNAANVFGNRDFIINGHYFVA